MADGPPTGQEAKPFGAREDVSAVADTCQQRALDGQVDAGFPGISVSRLGIPLHGHNRRARGAKDHVRQAFRSTASTPDGWKRKLGVSHKRQLLKRAEKGNRPNDLDLSAERALGRVPDWPDTGHRLRG